MSEDRVESTRNYAYYVISEFFKNHFPENAESMLTSFGEAYHKQLEQYVMREESEVEQLRRLIVSFRPALSSVLELCTEFDALMSMVQMTFKPVWDGAQRRKNTENEDFYSKKSRPIMPGSDSSTNLAFLCSVCGEEIEVSHDIKMQILNSDGDVELPQHCGQPSKIKISRTQIDEPINEEDEEDEAYEPIELLEVNDCDEISPSDVFDLIQIVTAELKAEIGIKPLASTTAEQYAAWRERQDSIVPGHTFRLGQYIYILTKRVLETTR